MKIKMFSNDIIDMPEMSNDLTLRGEKTLPMFISLFFLFCDALICSEEKRREEGLVHMVNLIYYGEAKF